MKYYPIIDNRQSCSQAKQQVKKEKKDQNIHFTSKLENADAILVGGGDGFMLQTMRKYHQAGMVFVGYNCGTLGFLMNNLASLEELPTNVDMIKGVSSYLIDVAVEDQSGQIHYSYCINDLTIGASVNDFFQIQIQSKKRSKKIEGTGLVIASPIGATGYALNLGAPLMPLESSLRCMVGIATHPFHYKYMAQERVEISVHSRNPISLACDGHAAVFENIQKVIITKSKQKVRLGFCPQQDFVNKRVMLAEQKLGGAC